MKPVIIALTGPAGCGKTTVAKELGKQGFVRVRFAGPLKDMMRVLGLTDAQVDGNEKETPCELLCGRTPREAMQRLGTEFGRNLIGENLWVNAAMQHVDAALADGLSVVIDDCRFDNEAQALKSRGAAIFELERKGAGTEHAHASEAGIAIEFIHGWVDNNCDVSDTVAEVRRRAAG